MAENVTAYIGLGGNIGDVVRHMQSALNALNANTKISITALSGVYKTPPWGIENQDWFLNACAEIDTSLSAYELLKECLLTEQKLKRVRDVRWGPRTIDLDVLIYGDKQFNEAKLQIPHPRMHERAFVLMPLVEIAPDLVFKGKSILQWSKLNKDDEIIQTNYKLTL